MAPAPSITEEKGPGNYIGRNVYGVLQELRQPTKTGTCQIALPVASRNYEDKLLIRGDGASYHKDGQTESYSIHSLLEFCAVFGVIVAQRLEIIERDANEETTFKAGRTDYILLRKLLEEGSNQDEYILKPGEHAI